MTTISKLLLVTLVSLLVSCGISTFDTTTKTTSLVTKDTTNEIEKYNTLFVFIGEKIDVTPIPHKPGNFDNGIKAKYKILQPVYGSYDKDVIEFEAYDHYGTPKFAEYNTVLLFVSEYKGKYYQEKYAFEPLAKTKDGRWAGPYSSEYGHPYNRHTSIKPEKIDFAEVA